MRVLLAQISLLPEILSKKISAWDFPGLAAQNGFQGVEWLDRLLPSLELSALRRLGRLNREAGLGQGALSLSIPYDASPKQLDKATARCLALLDACPEMEVGVVRVALARSGLTVGNLMEIAASLRPESFQRRDPLGWVGRWTYYALFRAGLTRNRGHVVTPSNTPKPKLNMAVQALAPLAKRAAEQDLTLGVENHWGLSGRPDDLLYTIGRLEEYGLGVCLDIDNFYKDQDPLAGIAALAPKAVHVHYKAHTKDAADEAKDLNYQDRLDALKAAGYAGAFSVEYEGPPPGLSGSRLAAELLRVMWEPEFSPT